MNSPRFRMFLAALFLCGPSVLPAEAAARPVTVAVFQFEAREDVGSKDAGGQVATLINARLSAEADLITVERAELDKLLGEQELGLSGTVSQESAAKVGHLLGARVLITGKLFKADKETILVAKVIGTETSRVYGEMVKSSTKPVSELADELAVRLAKVIGDKLDSLVAKEETRGQRIDRIKQALKGPARPAVLIRIPERHFGGPAVDPAAETELGALLQQCGFMVVDEKSERKPEVEIVGEAFSELGLRKGNLVSCKARVEIKMRRLKDGEVVAVDRQMSVAVDQSEQMAGKTALQQAAAELAERLIPKLAR